MFNIDFQTLESTHSLPHDITHETWFVTRKGLLRTLPPVRRDVYKLEDGSVVAVRDSGVGVDRVMYMDEDFMDFYKGEPEMDVIMSDQGITNYSSIKLYRME